MFAVLAESWGKSRRVRNPNERNTPKRNSVQVFGQLYYSWKTKLFGRLSLLAGKQALDVLRALGFPLLGKYSGRRA